MPAERTVKFNVRYQCDFGQEVCLVGDCEQLGNWDVSRGVQLKWQEGHVWHGTAQLQPGRRSHIEYKYVVRNSDGSVARWQEGANVTLDLPGNAATVALALAVEDSWNKVHQVQRLLAVATSPVRFNIHKRLEFGKRLVLVGGSAALGDWDLAKAVQLRWSTGDVWETRVDLPASSLVEYKYAVVNDSDGSVERWQRGTNLLLQVPQAFGNSGKRRGVLVLDTWAPATQRASTPASGVDEVAVEQEHMQARAPQQQQQSAHQHSEGWQDSPVLPQSGSGADAAQHARSSYTSSHRTSWQEAQLGRQAASPRSPPRPQPAQHQRPGWEHASSPYMSTPAGAPGAGAGAGQPPSSSSSAGQGSLRGSIRASPPRPRPNVAPVHNNIVAQRMRRSQIAAAESSSSSRTSVHLWTDKPRFGQAQPSGQAHQDAARSVVADMLATAARAHTPSERAHLQAMASVMAALAHSEELAFWSDDPTDPQVLAADRRLAALASSLTLAV